MKFKRTTLAVAAATALGLGAVGTAQADAYGFSNLRAYQISTSFDCNNTGTDNCITLTGYNAQSLSSANLVAGGGDSGFDAVVGIPPATNPDALEAQVGGGAGENQFTRPQGNGQVGDYARGDSQIVSQQVAGAAFTEVNAVAEGNLISQTISSASGTTTSGTSVTVDLEANEQFTLTLSMIADWYLESFADPGDGPATVTSNFALQLVQGGNVLFELSPGELQLDFTDDDTTDGMSTINSGVAQPFSDTSQPFDAGTYSLAYSHGVTTLLANTPAVPAPATLALLGLGLAGLGFGRRKRNTHTVAAG